MQLSQLPRLRKKALQSLAPAITTFDPEMTHDTSGHSLVATAILMNSPN